VLQYIKKIYSGIRMIWAKRTL